MGGFEEYSVVEVIVCEDLIGNWEVVRYDG